MEDEEELAGEADEEEEEEEAAVAAEPEEEGEASLDEILAKKTDGGGDGEEEDDESILALGRDDRIESLSVKVEPKKDTEFVCKKCHLVKPIRSQLVDRTRMLCRDCA